MKTVLMFGFLLATGFTSSAHAQVTKVPGAKYREFIVNVNVLSGESKAVTLQVNVDAEAVAMGDPEIPNHGHYDYNVTGSIVEGAQTCDFDLLLAQGSGERLTTEQLLKNKSDRAGSIQLCSGLTIETVSVRSLLLDTSLMVSLKAPGLSKAIGSGAITSNGIKTVPDAGVDGWDDHND